MTSLDPAEPEQPAAADPSLPPRVVFRVPRLGVLVVVAVALLATPVAFGAPYLWLVYAVPVILLVWVLRTRTTVDAESVTVRTLLGRRRVPWTDITSLRLRPPSRFGGADVRAVLTDGGELPLAAVHLRDLPVLAAVSGGRVPDPAGE